MRLLTFIFSGLLFSACGKELPSTTEQMKQYVSEPENGLVRSRTVEGIVTTVSLIPGNMNALREAGNKSDSCSTLLADLQAQYAGQLYFVVNLATDGERRTGDVMYTGVYNVESFKQQAYDLNFTWDEMVQLQCGPNTYRPVLSSFENTYGLTKDRNVIIVFAPQNTNDTDFFSSEFIDLEINNDLFGTGVQHFKFRRSDLERIQNTTVRA